MLELIGIVALVYVAWRVIRHFLRRSNASPGRPIDEASFRAMLGDLGETSFVINDAAANEGPLDVALQGAIAVSSMLKAMHEHYDLTVGEGTIFAEFLYAVKENRIEEMANMIEKMADALSQVSTVHQKGALIHFWIAGDQHSSL